MTVENESNQCIAFPSRPVFIVSDFNDQQAAAECAQKNHIAFLKRDIIHEAPTQIYDVEPFNITDGAFRILQLSGNMENYPAVFVGVVDPGVGSDRKGIVAVSKRNHVFVGPDNGLFGPVLAEEGVERVYEIDKYKREKSSTTFHGRDLFVPVATEIALGTSPEDLPQLEQLDPEKINLNNFLPGQVVKRDGYWNISVWQKGVPQNDEGIRASSVTITSPRVVFHRGFIPRKQFTVPVFNTFNDVRPGVMLAFEGSGGRHNGSPGLLEIARNKRSGRQNVGRYWNVGTKLGLEFHYKHP